MFWIISAILVFIALAFILPSLRNRNAIHDASREQNIAIAQEQLADLESRFEQGEVSQEDYESSRDEHEQALFNDIKNSDNHSSIATTKTSKMSLLGSTLILLLIPAISIPLYLKTGSLGFTTLLDSKQAAQQIKKSNVPMKADGTPDIDQMVAGLQKKMDANPDNAKGWYMLGRSYMVLKRYPEAAKAFESASKLQPDSADAMLSLADALSMSSQGQLAGRPTELVNKALKLDPQNLTALWLSGMAARQQGNYLDAITQWNKVLPLIIDKPEDTTEVNRLISEAKSQLSPELQEDLAKGAKVAVVDKNDSAAGIKVNISISEEMLKQSSPDDLVFIYAKAMSGPPMPLAALRKQVKDLPISVTLNDDMAMMPNLKLSGFPEVVVGARVSKTGRPIAENGDLYAEKSSIKEGDDVSLEINSVLSK